MAVNFPSSISYLFIFPSFYGNDLVSKTQASSNCSNNICRPPPGLDSVAPACSFAVPIAYLIFVPAGILFLYFYLDILKVYLIRFICIT